MTVLTLHDFKQFSPDKMKKNNLFQTPRFFCDIYGFEPGQAQKGHVPSDQDKVYIVLEGQCTIQVGTEERVLNPGQAVSAPAGMEHAVRNHTQQRLRGLVLVAPNTS